MPTLNPAVHCFLLLSRTSIFFLILFLPLRRSFIRFNIFHVLLLYIHASLLVFLGKFYQKPFCNLNIYCRLILLFPVLFLLLRHSNFIDSLYMISLFQNHIDNLSARYTSLSKQSYQPHIFFITWQTALVSDTGLHIAQWVLNNIFSICI